jgi:hypothetical protein
VNNALANGKDFSDSGITDGNDNFKIYKPVGCEKCDHIGYKGRIGIFEAILVDDKIAEIIATNPSERDIKHGSVHQGIFTMVEDGVAKILSGITTMEEVQSTVDMVEDLPEGWNKGSDQVMNNESQKSADDFIAPSIPENPLFNVSDMSFYSGSPEHDGTGVSLNGQKNMPMQELMALVDYLKLLEREQVINPEVGIKAKVGELKEIIVDLLKRSPLSQWVVSDPAVIVHDEISSIIKQLESLEEHQSKRPNIGVASQLHDIRNTIENLIVKG